MTPEIEKLQGVRDAAKAAKKLADQAYEGAVDGLNVAVAAWALEDLAQRGIVPLKTPVEGAKAPWRGEGDLRWQMGVFYVSSVAARDGLPDFHLVKIKADGKPSKAGNGLYGQIIAVRKAGETK